MLPINTSSSFASQKDRHQLGSKISKPGRASWLGSTGRSTSKVRGSFYGVAEEVFCMTYEAQQLNTEGRLGISIIEYKFLDKFSIFWCHEYCLCPFAEYEAGNSDATLFSNKIESKKYLCQNSFINTISWHR